VNAWAFLARFRSPSGYPQQSPFVAVANRQAEIMLRIASEFGFTPASRGRIATPVKDRKDLVDLMVGDNDKEEE
jgi:phage terminase small subunit